MVYLSADIQVAPGKMREFQELFGGAYLDRLKLLGRRLAGAWETEIGPSNQVVDLWAFESPAHLFQVRERQREDEVLRRLDRDLRPMISQHTLRLLRPLPYSPLQ